jgi:methionyl aminopeptidase
MWKKVIIKNNRQIQLIRDSWKYLTEILHLVKENAKPWVRLIDLENQVQRYLDFHNIKGAFKWYYWYPANLCLSVNDCVVHWIPDDYVLKEWDLLKVDCWVDYKWWISDAAFSMVIWWDDKNFQAANLYKGTKSALDEAIKVLRPWLNLIEYWKKIYSLLKNKNISVIRNLTGHWVWVKLHEAPTIFNFPEKSMKRYYLQKDMVIAIEPITAIKSKYAVEKPGKSWNMYTEYGDLGAHWEYTILITDNWYEILAGIIE